MSDKQPRTVRRKNCRPSAGAAPSGSHAPINTRPSDEGKGAGLPPARERGGVQSEALFPPLPVVPAGMSRHLGDPAAHAASRSSKESGN